MLVAVVPVRMSKCGVMIIYDCVNQSREIIEHSANALHQAAWGGGTKVALYGDLYHSINDCSYAAPAAKACDYSFMGH